MTYIKKFLDFRKLHFARPVIKACLDGAYKFLDRLGFKVLKFKDA